MSADLIARLIEAGTPAALVADVAVALARATAAQEAIETRRIKDRSRQQAKRDRDHVMSRDVTLDSVTGRDPLSLDKEKSPRPPKEINPLPRERETRTRGEVLPVGWKPQKLSRDTISGQIIERRGQDWARRTLESFDNHWRAKSGRDATKRDWQATWANWVIEQDRRDGRNGNGFQQSSRQGADRTIAAAIDVFGHPDDPAYQAVGGRA